MEKVFIFLQKSKEDYKWSYIIDDTRYSILSSNDMLSQMVDVLTRIRDTHELHDADVTVFSTAFIKRFHSDMKKIFPAMSLIAVVDTDLIRLFRKIMVTDTVRGSKKNNKTLFVCSDASRSPLVNICGWAWFSSDNSGSTNYSFGVSEEHSIVTAEFEGIMHAIVDNASKDFTTLHIYCDSKHSVDVALEYLKSKTIPNFAINDKRMRKLMEEVYVISKQKNVRIEWVRGHKSHRLNMGADYLSRKARQASERYSKLTKTDAEVNAVMRLFV
jgi:ribonuclease HI